MVTRFLVDETDSFPQDFECCTFDHSDNSPYGFGSVAGGVYCIRQILFAYNTNRY